MNEINRTKFSSHKMQDCLEAYEAALNSENFVLLETLQADKENCQSYLFSNPKEIIQTDRLESVAEKLRIADQRLAAGYYLAGYLTYEAGYAFEPRLQKLNPSSFTNKPLLWLGVFDKCHTVDFRTIDASLWRQKTYQLLQKAGGYDFNQQTFSVSESEYLNRIEAIKKEIAAGNTYQINLTFDVNFTLSGNHHAFYAVLREKQKVGYAAYIKHDQDYVMSLSPELFFRKSGHHILTKPMKGTAKRGKTAEEDNEIAAALRHCPKNMAENAMIVDLLRNDLGTVSQWGSVQCPQLFQIEKYETLFQMTSTVKSRLRPEIGFHDLFKNIFPSGSITGAPKISSMSIINAIEKKPRGIYTGALGFAAPNGDAVFNIPIRTLEIKNGVGRMGIGSGIVWDSDPLDEYNECCTKAKFLVEDFVEFELLETLLCHNRRYFLLKQHLERLEQSATYFHFPYSPEKVAQALAANAAQLNCGRHRTRLLLDRYGNVTIENSAYDGEFFFSFRSGEPQGKLAISDKKVRSSDLFLYHKTTNRGFYRDMQQSAQREGLYDYIFLNDRDEITEGCINNIFIRKGGSLYTPPVSCGLLPGVMRNLLISRHQVQEKILTVNDLQGADDIYLCNSVRGIKKVKL